MKALSCQGGDRLLKGRELWRKLAQPSMTRKYHPQRLSGRLCSGGTAPPSRPWSRRMPPEIARPTPVGEHHDASYLAPCRPAPTCGSPSTWAAPPKSNRTAPGPHQWVAANAMISVRSTVDLPVAVHLRPRHCLRPRTSRSSAAPVTARTADRYDKVRPARPAPAQRRSRAPSISGSSAAVARLDAQPVHDRPAGRAACKTVGVGTSAVPPTRTGCDTPQRAW